MDHGPDHRKIRTTTMIYRGFDPWLPGERQQNMSGFDGGNISESDEEYEITSDLD